MKFDPTYKQNRNKLPADIVRMMNKTFFERRAKGLNVQFITDKELLDEWSFATCAEKDRFCSRLKKIGREYAVSA